jgi:hypothetical protein
MNSQNHDIPPDDETDRRPEPDPASAFDPAGLDARTPDPAGPDPYDPARLGLNQDFAALSPAQPKLEIVKVERPTKSRVFRVHPTICLTTTLLTLKEDNEVYLVLPQLRAALARESLCAVHAVFACITKVGTPFLWPIPIADKNGKWNTWHQSAFQIAQQAKTRWARMQANRDAGHYEAEFDVRPPEQQATPIWPDMPFRDWLELAFKGHTIDRLDHPVLRRLRLED